MSLPPSEQSAGLETRSFVLLQVTVTLAFGVILLPFWGAVFWGVIIAILFAPLQRRLVRRMGQHRTWAALTTLAIILLIVMPPLVLIVATLVQESSGVYTRIQSGELNFGRYFQQIVNALPPWISAAELGMLMVIGVALRRRVRTGGGIAQAEAKVHVDV